MRFPKKSLLAPLRVQNRKLSGSEIHEQRLGGGGAKETPSELRCSQTDSAEPSSLIQSPAKDYCSVRAERLCLGGPSRWRPLRLTPPSPPHGVDSAERSEDLHVRMFGAGANQAPILFNIASHRAPGHRQQQGREPDGTN